MDKEIKYTKAAVRDMMEIADYIRLDSIQASENTEAEFRKSIGNLAKFRFLCPVPKDRRLAKKGYRMLVVGNYLVFYKVFKSTVRVCRVIHGKRLYGFLI
jgi:plasmid stabilization system protein ParE